MTDFPCSIPMSMFFGWRCGGMAAYQLSWFDAIVGLIGQHMGAEILSEDLRWAYVRTVRIRNPLCAGLA